MNDSDTMSCFTALDIQGFPQFFIGMLLAGGTIKTKKEKIMEKWIRVILIGFFVGISALTAFSVAGAQQGSSPMEADAPEGMETIHVTEGYKVIVPEGTKVRKIGGQIIVDDPDEGMLVRIRKMENRLAELEKTLSALKETGTDAGLEPGLRSRLNGLEDSQQRLRRDMDALRETVRESLTSPTEAAGSEEEQP